MDENLKTLHEVCEIFMESLADAKDKLRKSSGPVSVGDADYVDKLTHTIKSIKTTIAMMEADDEDGYSNRGGNSNRFIPWYYGGMSYEGGNMGGNRGGRSYARGRGARRDSMGRYSNEGYSYADSMDALLDEMRGMMDQLPQEKRRKAERLIDELSM